MNDDPRAADDDNAHKSDPNPSPPASRGAPRRAPLPDTLTTVGTVLSDRVCVGCSYNLVGQSIAREPHYGMLITRCPECGACAGVQEFPLTGIWARRLGFALAAIVMILMIVALPATSGTLFGIASGITDMRSSRAADHLQAQFSAVSQTTENEGWVQQQIRYAEWYVALDPGQPAFIAQPWALPTPMETTTFLLAILAAVAAGLVWAALLSGRGTISRIIWWMLITSLLGIFVAMSVIGNGVPVSAIGATGYITPWNTSASIVTPRVLPVVAGLTALVLLAVILAGDRLILIAIRLLLPPRMQRLFARAPFGPPR